MPLLSFLSDPLPRRRFCVRLASFTCDAMRESCWASEPDQRGSTARQLRLRFCKRKRILNALRPSILPGAQDLIGLCRFAPGMKHFLLSFENDYRAWRRPNSSNRVPWVLPPIGCIKSIRNPTNYVEGKV